MDGLDYVWIPPGKFQMGCVPVDAACAAHERPRHTVTLARGFWIGRTEVPVAAHRRFAAGYGEPAGEDHPVVRVTWSEANSFCLWSGGRLPTEAEWEYAARAGRDGLVYPLSNAVSHDDANYRGTDGLDAWRKTAPVASFRANGFGLHDMTGNVGEWVADWYEESYYGSSPSTDPRGPNNGRYRVLRGGSWDAVGKELRLSSRALLDPSLNVGDTIGFRCARDAPP